jgi:hypothetical protein
MDIQMIMDVIWHRIFIYNGNQFNDTTNQEIIEKVITDNDIYFYADTSTLKSKILPNIYKCDQNISITTLDAYLIKSIWIEYLISNRFISHKTNGFKHPSFQLGVYFDIYSSTKARTLM